MPDVLRLQSARDLPVLRVPIERYVSQAFHDLEMEKVWSRVWQFACREEEIAEPGSHVRYDIGDRSVIVVRGNDRELRAFHNVCLHRGRQLEEGESWTAAPELGMLAKIFDQDTFNLPKVQRGLRAAAHSHVTFGSYQETKIRHFHALLEKYIAA